MSEKELSKKLEKLPKHARMEVADFIDFLESKYAKEQQEAENFQSNFGSAKGLIEMAEDFDEPLEDFNEYQ